MKNRILIFIIVLLLSCMEIIMAGKPGEGISLSRFTLRPYFDISATYDDNPMLTQTNKTDDIFLEYELGANMLFKGRKIDVFGSIYMFAKDYMHDGGGDWLYAPDSLDFSGWGEALGLTFGTRDTLQIRARESYQQVMDYSRQPYSEAYVSEYTQDSFLSEDRGNRTERDLMDANIGLGRSITYKTEVDVSGNFSRTDYAAKELYDVNESTIHGEFAYKVTDKSSAFILGEYGVQITDALPGDPESKIIRGGWQTRFTDKTVFKGSVGIEYYDYNTTFELGQSSRYHIPSFDLGWIWLPTDRLSFNTTGGNTIEPSVYEENIRTVTMIGSSAAYQFTTAVMSWIGISYRKDNYKYEDPYYDITRKIDAFGGKFGVKYAPPGKWYSVYATAGYEETDSTIDVEDFDQLRLTIGAKFIY